MPRRTLVTVVAGLALVGFGAWYALDTSPPTHRDVARLILDDVSSSTITTSTTTTTTAPSPDAPGASGASGIAVTSVDAALASRPVQPPGPVPTAIAVEAIGATSPVAPVGVDAVGQVAVPPDAATAGWYRFGPAPGDTGSSVVVGHVDYDGRPGPFFRLADVTVGSRVVVSFDDGSQRAFAVSVVGRVAKADLPTSELFRPDGPARLVLVTCGGRFRTEERSYADNVVVLADPIPPPNVVQEIGPDAETPA